MQNLTARTPSSYEDIIAAYLHVHKGSATKTGTGSTKALYGSKSNLTFVSHLTVRRVLTSKAAFYRRIRSTAHEVSTHGSPILSAAPLL